MANKNTTNTNIIGFYNEKSIKINIIDLFNNSMSLIDSIRSYTNTSPVIDSNISQYVDEFKEGVFNLKKETTPQESRCHAFYRLIGFPVVDKDMNYYNPGYDKTGLKRTAEDEKNFKENKISQETKYNIAKNQIKGFRKISNAREKYYLDILNIFSNNSSIDSIALALSSKNKRQFNSPFDKIDEAGEFSKETPFNMNEKDQEYKIYDSTRVGKESDIKLLEFYDNNGNKPSKFETLRNHIMIPFMTDPIINMSIEDSGKLTSVPFSPDKSYTFIKNGTEGKGYAKTCYLEKIIRDRFFNPSKPLGTADEALLTNISNDSTINNLSLVGYLTDYNNYDSQRIQFLKFYRTVEAMMLELYTAVNVIDRIQSNYYWLPIPSKLGPEKGCDVNELILFLYDAKLLTEKDNDLRILWAKYIQSSSNRDVENKKSNPDDGNFEFDKFLMSFSPEASNAYENIFEKEYNSMKLQRQKELTDANKALQVIEMIMGEFGGLGLCDIIAITFALYLIPDKDILGFLDKDALDRFNNEVQSIAIYKKKQDAQDAGLEEGTYFEVSNIEDAYFSFIKTLRDCYIIMDTLYDNLVKGKTK